MNNKAETIELNYNTQTGIATGLEKAAEYLFTESMTLFRFGKDGEAQQLRSLAHELLEAAKNTRKEATEKKKLEIGEK